MPQQDQETLNGQLKIVNQYTDGVFMVIMKQFLKSWDLFLEPFPKKMFLWDTKILTENTEYLSENNEDSPFFIKRLIPYKRAQEQKQRNNMSTIIDLPDSSLTPSASTSWNME